MVSTKADHSNSASEVVAVIILVMSLLCTLGSQCEKESKNLRPQWRK